MDILRLLWFIKTKMLIFNAIFRRVKQVSEECLQVPKKMYLCASFEIFN